MPNYIIDGARLTAIADVPRLCNDYPITYTVDKLPNAIATMNPLNMLYGGNLGHPEGYTAIAGSYGTVELLHDWTIPGTQNVINNVLHWNITNSPADNAQIRLFYTNQPETTPFNKWVTNWTHALVLYNDSDNVLNCMWRRGYQYQVFNQEGQLDINPHSWASYGSTNTWSNMSRGPINAIQRFDIIGPYTGDFYILGVATYGMDLVYQSDISQWEG